MGETGVSVSGAITSQSAMQLTGLTDLLIRLLAREFNVDKVDLKFLVGLDTDQERRTTTGGDGFVGVMLRLEDKGK